MGIDARLIRCAFSCLLLLSVQCELTKKPSNTLVSFGGTSVLQCCSNIPNSNLEWKRYVDSLPQRITFCPNRTCHDSGYLFDEKDPGCSNLIIVDASASQAGLYHCQDVDTKEKAGAFLIVFNLNCRANSTNEQNLIEGADVLFRCTATWAGGSHLAMTWASENGSILSRTEFTKPQTTYSSGLRVTLQRPELRQYRATVQFLSTTITDPDVDKSTPMVSWSSTKRNIAYPVTDLQTDCRNDHCERQIDDTIFCEALGHPRPDIRWFDENGELVGERLKISNSGEQRFNCVATNTVGEKTYTAFRVINVLGKQSGINTQSLLLPLQNEDTLPYKLACVAVISLIVFIGVLSCYVVLKVLKDGKEMFPRGCLQRLISRQPTQQPKQVSNDPDEQEEHIVDDNRTPIIEQEEAIPLLTVIPHENRDNEADVGDSNRDSNLSLRKKESLDGNQPTGNIAQAVDESENEAESSSTRLSP